jgi:redox-sensitive bicupin YhaK (pirin superfamily)
MTEPRYTGLQQNQISTSALDAGRVTIHDVSGSLKPLTDIALMTVHFKAGGRTSFKASPERNVFFYVARGELAVSGTPVKAFHLAEFSADGDEIAVEAGTDAVVVFGHAQPYKEPIVSYGPFVMNTREEIQQAIRDYQAGLF